MKKIICLSIFFTAFTHAYDNCVLGQGCLPRPTEAEISEVDQMFDKVRYALGAVYDVQIAGITENPPPYKNITEYVDYIAPLKRDILELPAEADQLSNQAHAGFLKVAIREMIICVGSYGGSNFCHRALVSLKGYMWNKAYEESWSGYPIGKTWDGFPELMK
ncbi:MAG: hypothetical protein V3V40_06125 [Nitrosomonadaceae bacterium]